MTRSVRVTLCPGAQARVEGNGAGMSVNTSRIRIRSVLLSINCCPDVFDDGVLVIEGAEHGHCGG